MLATFTMRPVARVPAREDGANQHPIWPSSDRSSMRPMTSRRGRPAKCCFGGRMLECCFGGRMLGNRACSDMECRFMREIWSGRPDLNRRPPVPQTGALPDCATPRRTGSLSPGRLAPCHRGVPSRRQSPSVFRLAASRVTEDGPMLAVAPGRSNRSCQPSISCPLDGPTSAAEATRGIGPVCTARCHARQDVGAAPDRWHGSKRWRQAWPKAHQVDA